jgi:hypothetical protein
MSMLQIQRNGKTSIYALNIKYSNTIHIFRYLNTNNFLRSVRNFKMDITHTDPNAYVCAIHWQVAQGTTLENIDFYMSQADGNTQQVTSPLFPIFLCPG